MKPPKSKVAHFENVDLRELRVTPASLRLRRCIIGASISYILIFTPVLAYFIHSYMMAPPDLSRPRNSESGQPSKTCSNRRLPSFHLGFHRTGRHVDGNGSVHVNDSHWGPPQSSRQQDSVANLSRDRNRQANRTASGGGGSPVGSATTGHKQATSVDTEAPEAAAPILEQVNRVDGVHLAAGAVLAAGAAENQMLQKQPQMEPGTQREASGRTQFESVRRGHSPAGFRMNELPVQIGHQEMAIGKDPDESSHNGIIQRNPASRVTGSAPSRDGRHGKLKATREMVPAASQNDTGLRVSEDKQSSIGELESSRKRKEGKPRAAKEGTLPRKQKERVKSYVNIEISGNDASEGVHPFVPSNGHEKDNSDVPREVAASGYRMSTTYANGAKGFGKDKRGYKGALSSVVGRRTAEELRRLRSDKLMLKLRKAHNLAKLSKDPKRGAVFGSVAGEDGRGSARQVDIAFQRELAQLIEGKGRTGNRTVRVSGAGYRGRSDQNGSDLSSVENSGKQRMIEGIPSNNKEANEVLSFAEFFKKHLSPNQEPSKVHSAVNALQGRRLMIDYMTKKKGKDTLQEGFPAGGWPEKPEASAPTKYTLDPYHPYISRRGDGWDFYDPLKPTTERNDARELAEQEFYSPDLSAADLQKRLTGRLLAPPPPEPVPFFGFNESSLQELSKGWSQNKGSAVTGNESGAGEPANIRLAVSAAIHHSFPARKAKLENSGQVFRGNHLSPNLINRYAVTEGTITAAFQHETAVGGKKSEYSSEDAPSGSERGKSDSQLQEQRPAFGRSVGNPAQGDVKKFPPGNLIYDESPRSRTALPFIGSPSNSSTSTPDDNNGQGDVHDNFPNYDTTAPYYGNNAGSRNDKSAGNKSPRGSNEVIDNREDQKLQNRGSAQSERNAEVQNNGLPSSGIRDSEVDQKPNSSVFAGVSSNHSHAIFESTGQSVATGTKAPEGDSASMQDRKVEFAHNGGNRNTSAGNAAFNNDHGASQNNSMVHAGLMNIEPIPIERPDFIAIGDSNDTNVTTAEDWAALSTHGKEYEDIIPEKERGIFQSRLNLNHNDSFLKEDALSGNLSASVPTPKRNETQSFEPEVMDLTPPRGLTSASKREFTRSRSAVSRPGSAKPAPLATDRTTDEIDNVDDARNHEENYLRIDARAVTKEKFTESSNIHIIIQNKRKTSGKFRTIGVALNEVPKLGVPNISGNHVPSARNSTKYFSQDTTTISLGTQARTSETTTGAKASTQPREKLGLASTPKGPEKLSTPNQSIHRSTVYTTKSSDERDSKGLTKLPLEGFTHRNVTMAAPKIHPSVVTRPTRHSVKLENINNIVIEVLRKRRGHRQLPFESTKVNDDNSSHSYTGTGHPISTMTSKNTGNTASSLDASNRQSNISALAQTSTTSAPSLGTVKATLKKSTWRTVSLNEVVPDEKYNFTRSEELTHFSTHAANKRGHSELITRSTRITTTEEGKSSSNNSLLEKSLTGITQSTEQNIRVSGIEPHNRVIHEDKRSLTTNRKESSQVRRDTRKVSSATSPTATLAAREPMRSEDNATTIISVNQRESLGGGKSLTPSVTHLRKETSQSKVPSTRAALAEISTSIDKRMTITIEVEQHSNHSGNERQPVIYRPTTKKLDRMKKVVTTSHSINEHSNTDGRERALKPIAVDLVTKSARLTTSPPSRHSNMQDTSKKATSAGYESKTMTSSLNSSHSTPASNFTRAWAMTVEVTLASTRDTPVPEEGDAEDMLGMHDKRNQMVMPTSSSAGPTTTFKQTSISSLKSSPDVPVEGATKPQLVTVLQTKRKEKQTHTDPQARAQHTTSVEKLQTSSSKTPLPEGIRSQEPKVPSSEDVTSTSTGPTALVFDDGDDEDEDDDEARLHFPVVRISRRPSSTPRRPALMDLFSRPHLRKRSTTTLRPVLLNNIIARRGRHDHNQTTQHHRLQHDIAMRRRSHRESPPPRPYQMTLFYGEPLHAVRVAVKRRG